MHSHASITPLDATADMRGRTAIALFATAVTLVCILLIKPGSMAHFAWFFCVWTLFVMLFHREETGRFALAFLVNSALIGVFVLVQSTVFPDTYGTTSPLTATWTDDSYFFSAVADSVPPEMLTREEFWLYEPVFTKLIRAITPLAIYHPLDALFFQSGTAALLATFSAKLMLQLSRDRHMANVVFTFAVICPFLLMNGGAILLRDTLTAALFVYTLCCINDRRFVRAGLALLLQVAVRPGTGAILMFAYPIIYFIEIRDFVGRRPISTALSAILIVLGSAFALPFAVEYVGGMYSTGAVTLLGREVYTDLSADSSVNALFLSIQQMPFVVKLILNAAYIFMYPFLSIRTVFETQHFDARSFLLNLVAPIYSLWLNAWFFAGALRGKPVIDRQRGILIALAVVLILVGTYSLQTRHKTIIYPLYYILVAVGFAKASQNSRRLGYALAGLLFLVQVASQFR
ncbi:MAG TPA: hypothetical protein VM146_15900 [Steroidobacteraceae bacterium]|nr:hypothetical protein [Steroidobacteraceae bacterium]